MPGSPDGPASPSTLATKLRDKHKARVKAKSRLSFGGDDGENEGEGEFKVKKGNLRAKLALGADGIVSNVDHATPPSLASLNITPRREGPTYSKEYLQELKASTPSALPRPKPDQDQDVSMTDLDTSYDVEGALIIDSADTGETYIPSESSVKAAKEKRERLRSGKASGEEDFISLQVSKTEDFDVGPHPGSRLVREEDEIGDGEDEMAEYTGASERIALGKKSRKEEAKKKKLEMVELIDDAEEEDEETKEWEAKQRQRGGYLEAPQLAEAEKPVYKPTPIPPPIPVPQLEPSIARLTQAMADLSTSHASRTSRLSAIADERAALDKKEAELRELIAKAEEKRRWFAEMQENVDNVGEFLDEKFPLLEKLEEEFIILVRERQDVIYKRRKEDDEDDVAVLFGLPEPQVVPPEDQEYEKDELGRDVPRSAAVPTVSRSQRRQARQARRNHRLSRRQSTEPPEEGYSTDSSLTPVDQSDYTTALASITTRTSQILSDVKSRAFRDPRLGIGKWFAEWRENYEDVYRGAWGGLGLVSAWEFWGRLEMCGWDPIEDPRSLDSFDWFQALHDYSAFDEPEDADDPPRRVEDDLSAGMVSKAAIPRIAKVIDHGSGGAGLDPYSSKGTRRVIDIVEEVLSYVGNEGTSVQALLRSVTFAFESATSTIESVLLPAVSLTQSSSSSYRASPFNPESLLSRQRFINRRLKLLQNLLRWRKFLVSHKLDQVENAVMRSVEECVGRILGERGLGFIVESALSGGWDPSDVVAKVSLFRNSVHLDAHSLLCLRSGS
ncbi:hypothetical protein SISNIDRAFT_416795 [Sistotremastrum niveocremeum HHB9708]|uniref:GCFC-domain-containing protein n=1 Tax=Sistotremastrum niveocremeum HHB9708 TaxID=1314777 RepID=A0A164Q9D7_9AGAM|nr:hypothetical protein SISNIDRAFT_416795 [Sistotremastrum niveocremeum HHB9708]